MTRQTEAAIAAHRFGMGAGPQDLERISADPKAWLRAQTRDPAAFMVTRADLISAADGFARFADYRMAQRDAPDNAEKAAASIRQDIAPILAAEVSARTDHAIATPNGYAERLALFWANHFTVAAVKAQTLPLAGAYEREAVRANLTGTFADLLSATSRHTGMLIYLDQAQSIGPSTRLAKRRDLGLNENLAREILELHTVGVDSGYTQDDVTEFARALTGWTVSSRLTARFAPDIPIGQSFFADTLHEPGTRTIMGKRYAQSGAAQSAAILADLAAHPATAKRIARKLATHLIADNPPASAVTALETAFTRSGGSLPALHAAAVDLKEAWDPQPAKFRTPYEFLTASLRALGQKTLPVLRLQQTFQLLGRHPCAHPRRKAGRMTRQAGRAPTPS
jgi:uncharacterized protein (DUF1800 family)